MFSMGHASIRSRSALAITSFELSEQGACITFADADDKMNKLSFASDVSLSYNV